VSFTFIIIITIIVTIAISHVFYRSEAVLKRNESLKQHKTANKHRITAMTLVSSSRSP